MRYKISLSLVFHIYDGYLGQRPVINAMRQAEQMKLTLEGIVIRGEGGCGRTHDYNSPLHFRSHHRRVSPVVAKTSFLFV
jgi:hypothetical protein